jgi:catechol 2,3-dioxygenase-like lactoylglutathione lyase family enzyme
MTGHASEMDKSRGIEVMIDLHSLDHIALAVRDVAASAAWYADVLGLKRVHAEVWGDVPTMMSAPNGTMIALFPARAETGGDAPPPPGGRGPRFLHLAFRTDRAGFERAREDLAARGIAFHFQDHTVAHSIYFRDPDGHELEITTYEV